MTSSNNKNNRKLLFIFVCGFCASSILNQILAFPKQQSGRSLRDESPIDIYGPPPTTSNNRVADKMKDVFQFSRGSSQLLLEAAYATKEESSDFLYSEDDLHMIQRSIYTLLGFTNIHLWSSGPGEAHFFGTGSCLIQLGRPAMEVALGILHGIYLKQWRNHVYRPEQWSECDERYTLRQVLGTELETFLWIESGSGATGPWDTCISAWQQMADRRHSDKKIKAFLDSTPIAFQLCDEMDEVMGGDGMLGGNWKRRSNEFYHQLIQLTNSMGYLSLVPQLHAAMDFANTVFPAHPTQFYKQLHPCNHSFLFGTTELSKEAHPSDLERFRFLHQQGRHDRQLLPLPKGNQMQSSLIAGIDKARNWCDSVANRTMTLAEYIKAMKGLKDSLLYCEKHDPRFFRNHTKDSAAPPRIIPSVTIPPRVPKHIQSKHPDYFKNYDYDSEYEVRLLERLLEQ